MAARSCFALGCVMRTRDRIKESLKETTAQVLMGHFEIAGFEMHRGAMCDHGESIDSFSKFDIVYSGHFHHRSTSS
jgi:hypothetical protein